MVYITLVSIVPVNFWLQLPLSLVPAPQDCGSEGLLSWQDGPEHVALSPQVTDEQRGVPRVSWWSQSCCPWCSWATETFGEATWSLPPGVLLPIQGSSRIRKPVPSAPRAGKDVSPVSSSAWENAFVFCVDCPQNVIVCMKGLNCISVLCVLNYQL